MNETFFPLADLLRRKLQTSLVVTILALSVASTLSLLLFCDRVGLGILSTGDIMTKGLTAVLFQFVTFVEILVFAVGAVIVTFVAYLMMTQRRRDIGLIKAAGCPNGLVAGYFMTELLLVIIAGCTLGVLSGIFVDYVVSRSGDYQFIQGNPNYWLVLLVFVTFFVLALVFGMKPILDASRMSPIKALSPLIYFGLSGKKEFKPLSDHGLTWRLSYRSLVRRQSATLRIVALLSIVFILTTVVVAGSIIASDSTVSWIESSSDGKTVAIAHMEMAAQYDLLRSKFSTHFDQVERFNYSDERFAISPDAIQLLKNIPGVSEIDPRLILEEHIREVGNFTIDPETLATLPVGDSREGDSVIIGVDPSKLSLHSIQGRTIDAGSLSEAVIGDSIAHSMFSPNPSKGISLSNPLVQTVGIRGGSFTIVGVRVDPINNGRVVYVPIQKLANITDVVYTNIVFVTVAQSADFTTTVAEIRRNMTEANPNLDVIEIAHISKKNVGFLKSIWSTIMILPLFVLSSAALCLVGYLIAALDEQKKEFATLRALGGKSKLVVTSLAFQSSIILLSGFGIGVSLGIVVTLVILMANPLVSILTVLEIAAWLFSALVGIFIVTLIPAFSMAKSPILRHMI